MYKYICAVLAGALATLALIFVKQDPKNITVAGNYVEDQKVKDNRKIKAKKGVFGWIKRDPKKKAARKERKALRKEKK